MRVLIVDDDRMDRTVLEHILGRSSTVHTANDGEEALDMFGRGIDDGAPYDVVILDIIMPGIDGVTTCKLMRLIERARGVAGRSRFFFISAHHDLRGMGEGIFPEGRNVFFSKPVLNSIGEIRRVVQAAGMGGLASA